MARNLKQGPPKAGPRRRPHGARDQPAGGPRGLARLRLGRRPRDGPVLHRRRAGTFYRIFTEFLHFLQNFANFWRARSRLYQNEILQENNTKYAFDSSFQALHDLHTFVPL